MSGPDTGGPPSGPRTDRLMSGLDAAISEVMARLASISRPTRGGTVRDTSTNHRIHGRKSRRSSAA